MKSNRTKLSNKLLFCAENLWRRVFLFKKNPIFKTGEKFIHSRSSIIPHIFTTYNVYIYTGRNWNSRLINKWMVGHKFGEFTWNRKVALYKAKQQKKKNNFMKFEQLLQVYWSKGFLYGGRVRPFNVTLSQFFSELKGLGYTSQNLFIKRFELTPFKFAHQKNLLTFNIEKRKIMNMYLSQLTSINNSVSELNRYNVLKLYLIKSFRGRAQALGKPSRGQRTWSNAWTSYKYNKLIRVFINEIKKTSFIKKAPESKNQKMLKKKIKKSPTRIKIKEPKKQTNLWF